jgi:hypothetical protein
VKAGVRLVTVTEGPINWDDFSGRMVYAMKQEGKHQFLVDLSRNTARGMTRVAQKGFLCGQAAPYGFDRMLVDESGKHRQRIHGGEKFAKPRSWHTTLVHSDDPQKVATVRWLFTTYATTDTGLRSLADQLNARGVKGPSGGAWYAASIKAILENQNYTGTFTWAKRREGKYHSVTGGEIRQRDQGEVVLSPAGKPLAIDNPEAAWIVVDDAHEPLVDKATFQKVQERMHERRRSAPNAGYRTHTKQNGDVYLLSGLVFCAHCGCKMHGSTLRAKGIEYPKYICSTYARSGKSNLHNCGYHTMHQGKLVDVLVNKLQSDLLSGSGLEQFQAAVRRQLEARQKPSKQDAAALRKQLARLDSEIEQAADNFLRAPADLLEIIGTKLSAMKRQRQDLAEALQRTTKPVREANIDREVEAVTARLWRLGEELEQAKPERRRELFNLLVDRIDLRFDKVRRGQRVECPLICGEIYLNCNTCGVFGSVNRENKTSF